MQPLVRVAADPVRGAGAVAGRARGCTCCSTACAGATSVAPFLAALALFVLCFVGLLISFYPVPGADVRHALGGGRARHEPRVPAGGRGRVLIPMILALHGLFVLGVPRQGGRRWRRISLVSTWGSIDVARHPETYRLVRRDLGVQRRGTGCGRGCNPPCIADAVIPRPTHSSQEMNQLVGASHHECDASSHHELLRIHSAAYFMKHSHNESVGGARDFLPTRQPPPVAPHDSSRQARRCPPLACRD